MPKEARNFKLAAALFYSHIVILLLQGLSKPLFSYKFDVVRSPLDPAGGGGTGLSAGGLGTLDKDARENDGNEFISAVCWRPGTNCVLGANSQGTIKILELV